jgi:hypothetical protein
LPNNDATTIYMDGKNIYRWKEASIKKNQL